MTAFIFALSLGALSSPEAGPGDAAGLAFFESRIRPLLVEKCQDCHSTSRREPRGGLRLDSRAGWMRGGDSGPAIRPGQPGQSLLVEAVRYENPDLQMPPREKLTGREIADLVRWIELGAPDPREEEPGAPGRVESDGADIAARRAGHWAWQAIRAVEPPGVQDTAWPRSPIDQFVLARLEAEGLAPAPQADRRTWYRRVSFDLTGLPPRPADLDAFERDTSEAAHAIAVRRLLASPHYGEHWGQHWLDLVRYAETRGHEQDFPIPFAFRYRDYVIRALNEDVPYDRFLVEHVAGDLLDEPRIDPESRTNQSIQGTGFWHLGEATHSPVDIRGDEADRVANQIDVFSRAFLGLSIGCARCHDHKFDAISMRDYYGLFGFLQSSSYQLADVSDPGAQATAAADLDTLRDGAGATLLSSFAAAVQERVARMDHYLLAAGERLAARKAGGAGESRSDTADRPPLDEVRVGLWVDQLERASTDTDDPFFPFATVVLEAGADALDASRLGRGLESAHRARERARLERERRAAALEVVRSVAQGERNYVRTRRPLQATDTVVDYGAGAPASWITAGHRFGARPARAGEVVFGSGTGRPVERVLEEGAAHAGLRSHRLTGMLRTHTFEITSDTLWYRFRGKAEVFLAVDSHRVVAGPLHGVVKQKLSAGGDHYVWQAHNVRDYIGHRVHVEFKPEGDFSIARIQFSGERPVDPLLPQPLVREHLENDPPESLGDLARGLRDVFLEAMDRLAAGDLPQAPDARRVARLANWLIRHDALLDPPGASGRRLESDLAAFLSARAAIERRIPEPVLALALLDGSGEEEPLHIRGSHRNRSGEPVPRRFLEALDGPAPLEIGRGSGRLELARRLVAPDNPLVPRVIVNRVWHHLLGQGIVETVDDFGAMGRAPSHPDLLDFLARRFIDNDWSLKRLVEDIVLSSTYRMSSRLDPRHERLDPTNRLLHRMPIRRLTAESIRDSILAVSGRLDPRLHGPSVMVHITPFMRNNRSPSGSGPLDGDGRRSIYIEVRRNHLSSMLVAFDKPVPFTTMGRRHVSNSPAQPLILLNDPFVHEQAAHFARRLLALSGATPTDRIRRAYELALGRLPADWEVDAALTFLSDDETLRSRIDSTGPWSDLCHMLFNVKEFIYLH